MLITEQIEETRDFLKRIRASGRFVRLVPMCSPLHQGKFELLRSAALDGSTVLLAILGAPVAGALVESLGSFVSACYRAPELPHSLRPEELFGGMFSVDEIAVGEKDFARLRGFEEFAKQKLRRPTRRFGIFRDVDKLPWSRSSQLFSAEERFSARYVPQALEKAASMAMGGELRASLLIEQTCENLEKSQGLAVCSVEIASGTDWNAETCRPPQITETVVPGARLCITCRAGEHLISDNRELLPATV